MSRLFWEKCKKQISKSKDTYYEYLIHFQIEFAKKESCFNKVWQGLHVRALPV